MTLSRRDILAQGSKLLLLTGAAAAGLESLRGDAPQPAAEYNMADHWWGMIIDTAKCIGCGNCVRACSTENDVPKGYYRTWVERYQVLGADLEHPRVDSPSGAIEGFPAEARREEARRDAESARRTSEEMRRFREDLIRNRLAEREALEREKRQQREDQRRARR